MLELPFKYPHFDKETKESIFQKAKLEEDMTGEAIRFALKEKLANFLLAQERNYSGTNTNPFDLIVGEKEGIDMAGFEIKGDTDNFLRLSNQLHAYSFTFDKIYLVLHKKAAPEWLPEYVEVIRILKSGDVYIDKIGMHRDPFDISTEYEWDTILKMNGIAIKKNRVTGIMNLLLDVRKNILHNRFFAESSGFNTHKFNKFMPLTEEQIAIIAGFDIKEHYKGLEKDLTLLEKRMDLLKKLMGVGKNLKDYAALEATQSERK